MAVVQVDKVRKIEIDLKREISFIINNKVKDPRVRFITITDTKLSSDFKWLDIFVSIMDQEDRTSKSLEGLRNCCGFIKKNLQHRFKLKSMPNIRFLHDRSIDEGMRISKILETLNKDKKS